MKKHLVVAFISCFPILGISSDTVLIKIVTAPYSIREIASDFKGNIYVNSSIGVLIFDGNKFTPSSKKFENNEIMTSYNGEITSIQRLREKGLIVNQNDFLSEEWAKKADSPLKVWVAYSKNGIYWVLKENKYLLAFQIHDELKIELTKHSIRGIFWDGNSLWVSTYNGIYKDGIRIFENEVKFSNTNFSMVGDSIFFGANFDLNYISVKNQTLNSFVPHSKFENLDELSVVEYYNDKIWIGGTKGIMVYDGNQLREISTDLYVHNFVIIENEFYVCANHGLFVYKDGKFTRFSNIKNATAAVKIGSSLFISSFSGLWEYNLNDLTITNLLRNSEFEFIETATILNDDIGNLWIGTTRGILKYNLESKTINNYLPYFEFNRRSSFKKGDTLFFGGVHGLVSFDYKKLISKEKLVSLNTEEKNSNFTMIIFGLIFGIVFSLLIFYLLFKKAQVKTDLNHENLTFSNVQEYIYNNIDTVNVDDLRNKMGLSKHAFYDGFDLNFNKKPKELILDIKKKKAMHLIKKSRFK